MPFASREEPCFSVQQRVTLLCEGGEVGETLDSSASCRPRQRVSLIR